MRITILNVLCGSMEVEVGGLGMNIYEKLMNIQSELKAPQKSV